MRQRLIVIGTRGSKLALIQTEIVKNILLKVNPQLKIEIKIIHTKGDRDMRPVPLDIVGKGWFTKELDKALVDGKIDLAVHSLKDIPEDMPTDLVIASIPQREDAREAFISAKGVRFKNLKKGSVVGTDSTRRKVQILNIRPDLIIRSLRGNIDTRLSKLSQGEYDGIFLAVAGLKRLGLEHKITDYFDEEDFIPSPGQGALAIVISKTNSELKKILGKLNSRELLAAIKAERVFSQTFGGSCKMPVGAFSEIKNNKLTLHGVVGSMDGRHIERGSMSGEVSDARKIGRKLAQSLLKKCGPWFNSSQFVVVTRPEEEKDFEKKLVGLGLRVVSYPTIKIEKNKLDEKDKKYLKNLSNFDWLVFTSRHGVSFFMEEIKKIRIHPKSLENKLIAAVGSRTADEIKKIGLHIDFMPKEFTTENLGKGLKNIKDKKILLARSDIANPVLEKILRLKGAEVKNISIYKTGFISRPNKIFQKLLKEKNIKCLTFTSPSTVEGFIKSINPLKKEILSLPVLSIGPVTSKKAKELGFMNIYTAKEHTINGMIIKLKENIL